VCGVFVVCVCESDVYVSGVFVWCESVVCVCVHVCGVCAYVHVCVCVVCVCVCSMCVFLSCESNPRLWACWTRASSLNCIPFCRNGLLWGITN
jgi:hypothetical protein